MLDKENRHKAELSACAGFFHFSDSILKIFLRIPDKNLGLRTTTICIQIPPTLFLVISICSFFKKVPAAKKKASISLDNKRHADF